MSAAENFWVPDVFSAATLLRQNDVYYLSTGRTPAMLYVVRLEELPYKFAGGLPKEEADETRIPANDSKQDSFEDPLCEGESTKALTLKIGRSLVSKLLISMEEVKIFDYTLHVAGQILETKCGNNLLLRRGSREFSLLGWLVEKGGILKARVSSLIDILDSMGIKMLKNATKAQRIRKILTLDAVKQECSQASIDRILKALEQQEEKRKAKQDDKQQAADPAKDEEEITWEELEDDPAARACRELLQGQDEEEEEEETVGKEPAGQEALPAAGGQAEEASRASRAMLSATTALPPDLLRLMPLPPGTFMNKVVHSNRTLPHFQGRLQAGQMVDGKTRVCMQISGWQTFVTKADWFPFAEEDRRTAAESEASSPGAGPAKAFPCPDLDLVSASETCQAASPSGSDAGAGPPAAKTVSVWSCNRFGDFWWHAAGR
ncbi:unnamed protein product [Symbiodinium sp. CCMP2592]|nr:unnamed protein product [Symbiodinium sp. CCMP2592]